MDIRDRLQDELTGEELQHLYTSFDIVGDIAIIKVPDELEHRKDTIADAVLEQHKNVNTVIRKTDERSGEFRTADYEVIKGDSTETIYKEHGCRLKLDPTKVYFSERLGHERQRVMEQVEQGETVIDMFAGIGPFTALIARNRDPGHVYAFEKNPDGAHYLQENIILNNVDDVVTAVEGDVRDELSRIDPAEADRIIMNLPGSADEFVALAAQYIKPGGTIHFYSFEPKDDLWETAIENVEALFAEHGMDAEVVEKDICGHYNPAVERICFDIKVTGKDI